ncbi:MAG: HNH endonuclease signature motif containing protein [Janthinobacterium lividum]
MAYHGINQNTLKTHCKRGHEFTRENTRIVKAGRACKKCQHLYYLEHRSPLRLIKSTADRFWEKVNKAPGLGRDGDCWEWMAACHQGGYGQFRYYNDTLAHRAAYQLTHGPILSDLWVLHNCDNRRCVNPAHLRLGTPQDNVNDMMERGRHYAANLTHCKRGHEFTPENIYPTRNGLRICRKCCNLRDTTRYYHSESRREHHRNVVERRRAAIVKPTTEQITAKFIEKAQAVHGIGIYDYCHTNYRHSKELVAIQCSTHGVFMQTPSSHLRGSGCFWCASAAVGRAQRLTTAEFIAKAKAIHHNKYDYSQVVYEANRAKVKIICSTHGVFMQTPSSHLRGSGCSQCGRKVARKLKNAGYLSGHNKFKTHCKRGHEFTPENTKILKSGGRACAKCAQLHNRRQR